MNKEIDITDALRARYKDREICSAFSVRAGAGDFISSKTIELKVHE
jgi:hypothetical protein